MNGIKVTWHWRHVPSETEGESSAVFPNHKAALNIMASWQGGDYVYSPIKIELAPPNSEWHADVHAKHHLWAFPAV